MGSKIIEPTNSTFYKDEMTIKGHTAQLKRGSSHAKAQGDNEEQMSTIYVSFCNEWRSWKSLAKEADIIDTWAMEQWRDSHDGADQQRE